MPQTFSILLDPSIPATPYPPSSVEAAYYYYGLPSRPRLVARSSVCVWDEPKPESYPVPKESSPIGFHPLLDCWEVTIGPAMIVFLDSKGVKWTSLDPLRMGYAGQSSPPVIIWMGVEPGSLSATDGINIAIGCREILSAHGINDVHIEIRESEVIRSANMYRPASLFNPTAEVREPLSTALGLPISPGAKRTIQGTGGLFFSDYRQRHKLYLLTARHVVLPLSTGPNTRYTHHNSSPGKKVLLFGDSGIDQYLAAIKTDISDKRDLIEHLKDRLQIAEQADEMDADAELERRKVPLLVNDEENALEALEKFSKVVAKDWADPKNRVLGHVSLSPPICPNARKDAEEDSKDEGFTEDWAIVEIDKSAINATNFVGNVIDLGYRIPVGEFRQRMHPHVANSNSNSFRYPGNRLLKLQGTIPYAEMWSPPPRTVDSDNQACIMVIKRGYGSGLTIGRLNNLCSFTRFIFDGQPSMKSKEVSILPESRSASPFSTPGDSGAIVVDGKGRIAGMLTAGAGTTDATDVTYATPINFIIKRMWEEHGIRANLCPSVTGSSAC